MLFIQARIAVSVSSLFFFSSRRRHTRSLCDWSSDMCSSDLDSQPAENRVKQIEARATQPSVGARAARRAHYLGAVAPRGDERGDDFGRVLQIRVHRHDGICAARVCEAGGERGLEAEVARELD